MGVPGQGDRSLSPETQKRGNGIAIRKITDKRLSAGWHFLAPLSHNYHTRQQAFYHSSQRKTYVVSIVRFHTSHLESSISRHAVIVVACGQAVLDPRSSFELAGVLIP